ncbi:hypothetical protein JCM21714_4790 [Gracilibacillus boraciitolerans JCM 21714]|uniref:Uncharacterized protein n=1 Tax=Gracilibacillus boraciitolerans JCM 21714 TaxID=1298598 RepID=W4VQL3_9BACI|nr:hypothetical protein JCM21714_4790 [Gracilibacillus boraciitolerans JCM 21714]
MIEASELLEQYKTVIEKDIVRLENTGEDLRETDENLARLSENSMGPQMIR